MQTHIGHTELKLTLKQQSQENICDLLKLISYQHAA